MANADVQEQLAETMYFMAAAIPLVSALAVIASYSNSAAEAAYAATRQALRQPHSSLRLPPAASRRFSADSRVSRSKRAT